jgi:hypothetical protein
MLINFFFTADLMIKTLVPLRDGERSPDRVRTGEMLEPTVSSIIHPRINNFLLLIVSLQVVFDDLSLRGRGGPAAAVAIQRFGSPTKSRLGAYLSHLAPPLPHDRSVFGFFFLL